MSTLFILLLCSSHYPFVPPIDIQHLLCDSKKKILHRYRPSHPVSVLTQMSIHTGCLFLTRPLDPRDIPALYDVVTHYETRKPYQT